ncbi:hypothetical protein [Streptomyces sp. NPDC001743]|uniref:hypothetical protein n=1 Tax=Streptomyces sp. NPDC001743 TaxID=3154397 RepID=UPI0033207B44
MTAHESRDPHADGPAPRTAGEEVAGEAERAARKVRPGDRDDGEPGEGDALTPNTEAQESAADDR